MRPIDILRDLGMSEGAIAMYLWRWQWADSSTILQWIVLDRDADLASRCAVPACRGSPRKRAIVCMRGNIILRFPGSRRVRRMGG